MSRGDRRTAPAPPARPYSSETNGPDADGDRHRDQELVAVAECDRALIADGAHQAHPMQPPDTRAARRAHPAARRPATLDSDVDAGARARRPGWRRSVSATRSISADCWNAFALLADLDQHWRFAGGFVDVLELDGAAGARTGGLLRVRGPLGMQRTVTTRLVSARARCILEGTAATRSGTTAHVAWTLSRARSGTIVELSVVIVHAGPLDRTLLNLGGRAWLRRQPAATLERFATAADHDTRPDLKAA